MDVSRSRHANQRQGNVQDLTFCFFHSSGQGHPTTVSVKYRCGEANFA